LLKATELITLHEILFTTSSHPQQNLYYQIWAAKSSKITPIRADKANIF
jgi:hypothetical protein